MLRLRPMAPAPVCSDAMARTRDSARQSLGRTATDVTGNGVKEKPHATVPVFENSPTFLMACRQLEVVADQIDLDRGVLERLSKRKRAIVVSIPIRMDDDRTEGFIGFRVQHS